MLNRIDVKKTLKMLGVSQDDLECVYGAVLSVSRVMEDTNFTGLFIRLVCRGKWQPKLILNIFQKEKVKICSTY